MAELQLHQFECLSDNYGVLVHSPETGETASIDAPEVMAVERALAEKGWKLTHILVTHHHADHTQGIAPLKEKYGARVVGPENPRIDTLDETVGDGDTFTFAGAPVEVITTPGHTLDMVNFFFPDQGVVFTGDTLFALGCGRVFEGDFNMMWSSMAKLMKLPASTTIYCGHEYTLANGEFALTVDPQNAALKARVEEIRQLRAAGKPTVPTRLDVELETNPFLRPADAGVRAHLGMENASDAEVFAEIRTRKDNA